MKYISKLTFFFCAAFLLCFSSNISAEPTTRSHKAREYLNRESVRVTAKGIFIIEDGKKVPVRALYADENGLYITKKNMNKDDLMTRNYCAEHDDWGFARWDGQKSCAECRNKDKQEKHEREKNQRGKDK